jgi:hypothetical protein
MKSLLTQPSLLLTILACTLFAAGQDQAQHPAIRYTQKQINFPSATTTESLGINNLGEIVGEYSPGQQSQNGFRDNHGKFTTIDCAPFSATVTSSINNKKEIVGTYATNDNGAVAGFIWDGNSSCTPVTFDSSGTTNVWGVNDSGTIAGFYKDSAGNFHGFLDVKGKFTTFDCAGATNTRIYGISNDGSLTGDIAPSPTGPFQGFLHKPGKSSKCTAINYPKAVWTSAKSINKKGMISGWYTDSSNVFHGFVKTGSHYQTVDAKGASNTLLFHMNDKGQIVGWFTDAKGVHGIELTPKP